MKKITRRKIDFNFRKMRIGLVLFGHLRSFRSTHDSYKQFLKTLQQSGDVDVFCHTWDIEESITPAWWKENKTDEVPPATVSDEDIIAAYKPMTFCIEQSKKFDEPDFGFENSTPMTGMLSMLYSQLKAFELLKEYEQKNGMQYDVVVKTRYDLLYEIADEFTSLAGLSVQKNCLYLPTSNPYELAGAYSDIFALGPRQLMEQYFTFNNNIKEAVAFYKNRGYRQLIPELCMSVYLESRQMPITETSGIRIQILRQGGEKFQINSDRNFENNFPLCFYKRSIEKCTDILPADSPVIKTNGSRLIKKYIGWILKEAGPNCFNEYESFFWGEWIALTKISVLAAFGKQTKLLAKNVLRDFFEMAMRNASYSFYKKCQLAFALFRSSEYGLFYFRVMRHV